MGIGWSYDFEPCGDMVECLCKARQNDSEEMLVSCARDEVDLDARGSGDGPYFCQITFYQDEPTVVYEYPSPLNWMELVELMERFAKGEDFTFVRQSWKYVREIDPMTLDELRNALKVKRFWRRKTVMPYLAYLLGALLLLGIFVLFYLR